LEQFEGFLVATLLPEETSQVVPTGWLAGFCGYPAPPFCLDNILGTPIPRS